MLNPAQCGFLKDQVARIWDPSPGHVCSLHSQAVCACGTGCVHKDLKECFIFLYKLCVLHGDAERSELKTMG